MAITATDLQNEVNTNSGDTEVLERIVSATGSQLDKFITEFANEDPHGIPDDVYDQAHLAMAVDEFNRRQAPNGILLQQFDAGDGGVGAAPVRISSDPFRAARPILSMWVTDIAIGGA